VHDGCGGLEAGLAMVSFGPVQRQRCVFQKVKNVLKAVKGDLQVPKAQKREHLRERREQILKDLGAIWTAPSEEQAREKESEFTAKWQDKEPAAVATLHNDFDATLTFYRVQEEVKEETGEQWDARLLRTISPLERKNRTIRAKIRSATIFQTERGLQAAAHLALGCRGRDEPDELADWLRHLTARLAGLPHQQLAPIPT